MVSKHRNKLILASLDIAALCISGVVGLLLRFDGRFPEMFLSTWGRYLVLAVPLYIVIYYYFGLYSRIWRYASADDLLNIAFAVSLGTALLFGIMYVNPELTFPRSVLVMTWFINVAAVGGSRFAVRVLEYYRKRPHSNGGKRTLIIGAGDAGRMLVTEIIKHAELETKLIGFLDDDPGKIGLMIADTPVLGPLSLLEELVQSQGIAEVIISMPSVPHTVVKDLVTRCSALSLKPRIVPGIYSVLSGCVQVNNIRDVQIEDLLPRPEVKTDLTGIASYIRGKTVLITGAGGSIGSELCRQIACFDPSSLLILGRGENSIFQIHNELRRDYPDISLTPIIADVQDKHRIEHIFSSLKPAVVFHAAAHKHVPLMEAHPTEALKNNVFGTQNVAEAAHAHGVERFVLISTDKAVNPTSVMGATKRIAEILVQSLNQHSTTKYMSVRFGNVLGSRGSIIPLFKEQIARGGPVTVTHPEMTRYFMTIPEAVSLVIQAGAMGKGGEVFILDMGEPVKILDLAKDLISLSGFKPDEDIKIEFVGVRPGEKLFEELLTAEEGTTSTQHKQIFVAKQGAPSQQTLLEGLSTARKLVTVSCEPHDVLNLAGMLNQVALQQIAAGNTGHYSEL
jgi:FlaA1/EpsC-like NDP-sugar epimerase